VKCELAREAKCLEKIHPSGTLATTWGQTHGSHVGKSVANHLRYGTTSGSRRMVIMQDLECQEVAPLAVILKECVKQFREYIL
jgi:hypothetical protein